MTDEAGAERDAVADLAQPDADHEQDAERAERDQHDHRAGRAESGAQRRADQRADDTAGPLELVERPVEVAVADVHQADGREQRQREPDAEAPAAPAGLDLFVFVVFAGWDRDDQRQRADHQGEGNEEPAAAEHGRGAVVDRAAERSGEVGVDAERGDDPEDAEQERERVGAVPLELFVEVVAPRRPDRDPAPAPRPTLLRCGPF